LQLSAHLEIGWTIDCWTIDFELGLFGFEFVSLLTCLASLSSRAQELDKCKVALANMGSRSLFADSERNKEFQETRHQERTLASQANILKSHSQKSFSKALQSMHCVAVCCVAVCCSVLCCSVLQCAVMQCDAVCCSVWQSFSKALESMP